MADIGRGKLGWTTSRGLGDVGAVFRTYIGYDSKRDTKRG
jgi:hypothetical protein